MKKNILPSIPYGSIPNVLLLGNGINLTFDKVSWDELLKKITTINLSDDDQKIIEGMPYSLRPVILSNDTIDKQIEKVSSQMLSSQISREHRQLIKEYVDSKFDAILTTNYTYEIELAIDEDFVCKSKARSKYRIKTVDNKSSKLNLYKYMNVSSDEVEHQIWHIHGEAARPTSMILGHYYYGKALGEIQSYVADFFRRYKGCNSRGIDFQPQSWIDYFLIGNVYIVGFGMDFSEIDLWWLINCKKRHPQNESKIYFFEPNLSKPNKNGIEMLAKAYGITVITESVNEKEYLSYYKKTIRQINEMVERNSHGNF